MTTVPSTFHGFPRLPTELRLKIWREALPEHAQNTLRLYRKGCWQPRRLNRDDQDYALNRPEPRINLYFRSDLLGGVGMLLSPALVNHEAHAVAKEWMRDGSSGPPKYRLEWHAARPLAVIRSLDLAHDAIYVPQDRFEDFVFEPNRRLACPDLSGKIVVIHGQDVKRVAIPMALLENHSGLATELLTYYPGVELLLIVLQTVGGTDLSSVDGELWRFEYTRGVCFTWDASSGAFTPRGCCDPDEAPDYERIAAAIALFPRSARWNMVQSFEVRPVLAVRREEA
ncbi:hypothetical protein ANO11243_076140 [Dothideomycetidae sp. 11243]|nr:hypothetical protein ANO11243_076140 [fungal sp. No.11243]